MLNHPYRDMNQTFNQHPLSSAFPKMDGEDFLSLKDSVSSIGVQNPIILYEGMILDGWHRYLAAQELQMPCPSVELGDVDPRDFVLAQNKARRHITTAQIALATAAVYTWHPAHRKEAHTQCDLPAKTNAELASIAGAHPNTITQAKAILTNATPEVVAAVRSGAIGLPKASKIAKLPKEQQAQAIHKPTPKTATKPDKPAQAADSMPPAEEVCTEVDALRDRIDDLLAELAIANAAPEDRDQASNLIREQAAEIKKLKAINRALTQSNNTLQNENAALMRQCATHRRSKK